MRDVKLLAVLATMISTWCVCGCSSSDDSKSDGGTTNPTGGAGTAAGTSGGSGNTAVPNGGAKNPNAGGGTSSGTGPSATGAAPGSGNGGTSGVSVGGKPGTATGGKPATGGTGAVVTPKGGATSATGGAPPVAGGTPSTINNPTKNPVAPGEEPPTDSNGLFVATDGSDTTGDGSIGKPYATIATALTKAPEGSSVILRAGTHKGGIRIRKKVTLRSHVGEFAKIESPIDASAEASCISIDFDADGTRLSRLEIVGGSLYAVMLQTKWDYGDPEDRTGATDVIIEDCVIHDTGRDAIKVTPGSDRATVRRTEIHHTGMRDSSNADGIDNVNGDSMHVYDSYIHDIATNGVYFKGGPMNCVIERTVVAKTGGGGIFLGFDTSPEFFDLEVNPDYYENIDGTVKNCLVMDTQYSGIGMFGAKNPKVFNNTVINAAQAGHAAIYFGLTFQDQDPDAGRPPTVNPTIYNNLVVQPKGRNCVGIRYSNEMGDMIGLSGAATMDNNLYFGEGGACTFDDRRPGQALTTTSVEEWAKHIGGEAKSLASDPGLSTLYRPKAGGPAAGAGKTLSDVTTDLMSRARSNPPTIGAFEAE